MSFTDLGEQIDKNSSDEKVEAGSEESYQTEEEIFNETFSDSLIKVKNISFEKNLKNSNGKARKEKNDFCKINVPVRYGRRNRFFHANNKSQKITQKKICKKIPVKGKNCLEKPTETPKKGKRCRAGGKAKAKPPEEVGDVLGSMVKESNDKYDSDEESENYFFSRISLGFFQKFKDLSGASTSNQWEEEHKRPLSVSNEVKIRDEISEEMELLELQNWGMAKSEKLEKIEYLNSDTF